MVDTRSDFARDEFGRGGLSPLRRGPQRPHRQPAHRGQPAVLHRLASACSAGQPSAQGVVRALDGRGVAAFGSRSATGCSRHGRSTPGSSRTTGWCRCRRASSRADIDRRDARVRLVPGARDPGRPPQHEPALDKTLAARRSCPLSPATRACTTPSTATSPRGARASTRTSCSSRSPAAPRLPHAGPGHPGLRGARASHRARRHLRRDPVRQPGGAPDARGLARSTSSRGSTRTASARGSASQRRSQPSSGSRPSPRPSRSPSSRRSSPASGKSPRSMIASAIRSTPDGDGGLAHRDLQGLGAVEDVVERLAASSSARRCLNRSRSQRMPWRSWAHSKYDATTPAGVREHVGDGHDAARVEDRLGLARRRAVRRLDDDLGGR